MMPANAEASIYRALNKVSIIYETRPFFVSRELMLQRARFGDISGCVAKINLRHQMSLSAFNYAAIWNKLRYSRLKTQSMLYTRSLSLNVETRSIRVNAVISGSVWSQAIPVTLLAGFLEMDVNWSIKRVVMNKAARWRGPARPERVRFALHTLDISDDKASGGKQFVVESIYCDTAVFGNPKSHGK